MVNVLTKSIATRFPGRSSAANVVPLGSEEHILNRKSNISLMLVKHILKE